MRSIKYITVGVLLALIMFCTAMYVSSCSKDACKGVTCLNKGTCKGGSCTCDSGIGGQNCETIYLRNYKNYLGNCVVTYAHLDSAALDSGYIAHTDDSNTIAFTTVSDTTYNMMQLTWTDHATQMLQTTITLINSNATGSTFTILPIKGGPGGNYMVSGNGTVSGNAASLNLTAVSAHPDSIPTIYYTLSNCPKL